ncbi:dihydroorotase family protein [Clostridium sp. AM58-1XD]|uniref:dihydroorotase n=1 Tax=Clostridium sp. AM58-1XD TaxID=2292307 RepID=UPI00241CD3BB|nr:dihydroorotase family protein [Clostridium sp. AM58-1XD]
MLDKLFINGTIVTKDSRFAGNIGITGEKITHILSPDVQPEAKEVIDLSGKYVLPGMIDAHVHFEDPGHTDREDMLHGTAACAAGGVTTVVLMPTNDPLIFTLDAYKKNLEAYKDRAYVDYGIHGAWTPAVSLMRGSFGGKAASLPSKFLCATPLQIWDLLQIRLCMRLWNWQRKKMPSSLFTVKMMKLLK